MTFTSIIQKGGSAAIFLLSILFIGGWFSSCERPIRTIEKGPLTFDQDTVKFDSIFVNFQTPSERLIAVNNQGYNIKVSRIYLEKGVDSEFDLIVDGIRADDISDLVVPHKDSIYIFVTLKSSLRNNFAEEYIVFEMGDEVQKVLIRAFVVDAYYFGTRKEKDPLTGEIRYFVPVVCDTIFTADKPIIIDGALIVKAGCYLKMNPGTHLYFTPFKDQNYNLFSQIYVEGTLECNGVPDNPVIMEGSRLEYDYYEQPGQWRGLRFGQNSQDNILSHVVLKNALVGVEVDSVSINANPKVSIRHSKIRNMGAYGILGVGFSDVVMGTAPMVLMENSYVCNAKDYTVFTFGGGNYEFYNCTFANYGYDFTRKSAQVRLNNFYEDENRQIFPYDLRTRMVNCAIWGSENHEILMEKNSSRAFDVNLDHCLVRINQQDFDYSEYLTDCLVNQNAGYNNPSEKDWRPIEGSPLVNAGADLSARYFFDIRGKMDSARTLPFDIGAYEYYPIED